MADQGKNEALVPVGPDVVQTLIDNRTRFRSYLSRRLGDDAAADELLQQSFLKAVESAGALRDSESVIPWFYRVLRNALTDHFRSRATDKKREQALLAELRGPDAGEAPPADELGKAVCQCLAGLLPTLRPEYADVLRKIDLEGRPQKAVAKELGLTSNNLGVKLHRARQAMKKSLERSCGACSEHACLDCTCR